MRPVTISAFAAAFLLLAGGASAQTSPATKVTPGNDATKAVGSQVPAEKVECPDNAAATPSQGQHAPTAAVGEATPTMKKPDCPDGQSATGQKK